MPEGSFTLHRLNPFRRGRASLRYERLVACRMIWRRLAGHVALVLIPYLGANILRHDMFLKLTTTARDRYAFYGSDVFSPCLAEDPTDVVELPLGGQRS
jgi:hypothetical protein